MLTNAQDNDEDDEGVHHRKERRGDRGDHFRQLRHSPKKPHDPEGAHQSDQPLGDVERAEVDKRHCDDDEIENIPSTTKEFERPVRK